MLVVQERTLVMSERTLVAYVGGKGSWSVAITEGHRLQWSWWLGKDRRWLN